MRAPRLSIAAALLALPLPALHFIRAAPTAGTFGQEQQDDKAKPGGAQKDAAPRDIYGRLIGERARNTPQDRLLGCWQLNGVEITGLPKDSRQGDGTLLIEESFMAFEVHLTWGEGQNSFDVHQSFIAEYELTSDGVLKARSIIGSFIDDLSGDLEWERGGFAREYRVTQTERALILEFGTNNRMTFRRRKPREIMQRDIYGRESTGQGPAGKRDIFGRLDRAKPKEDSAGGK